MISELADCELWRELLRLGSARSVSRFDELTRELPYVPVTTATWRRAAVLLASARTAGVVTAPPEAPYGDVLIGEQALDLDATIVTRNVKQFAALGIAAAEWSEVAIG